MFGSGGKMVPLSVTNDARAQTAPSTTLAQTLTATATTLALADDTKFPLNIYDSTGDDAWNQARQNSINVDSLHLRFKVRIDNEILLMTERTAANSWTVQRGLDGTFPAMHANGAPVTQVSPVCQYATNVLTLHSGDGLTVVPGLLKRGVSEAILRAQPSIATVVCQYQSVWTWDAGGGTPVFDQVESGDIGTGADGLWVDRVRPSQTNPPGDGKLHFSLPGVWLIQAQVNCLVDYQAKAAGTLTPGQAKLTVNLVNPSSANVLTAIYGTSFTTATSGVPVTYNLFTVDTIGHSAYANAVLVISSTDARYPTADFTLSAQSSLSMSAAGVGNGSITADTRFFFTRLMDFTVAKP